jgi:hypothetical protein
MKGSVSVVSRTFLFLAVLAPLVACLPEGGMLETGTGGTGGTGPINCGGAGGGGGKANWTSVREIVDLTCQGADCHTTGDREPYMIGPAGLLSDTDLYSKLTTYKAKRCQDRVMVKPCAPDESAFYLAQRGLCEGAIGGTIGPLPQMPFGCKPEYYNCTPDDALEGVRQWILNGAPR